MPVLPVIPVLPDNTGVMSWADVVGGLIIILLLGVAAYQTIIYCAWKSKNK